jgi:hypothetical protein
MKKINLLATLMLPLMLGACNKSLAPEEAAAEMPGQVTCLTDDNCGQSSEPVADGWEKVDLQGVSSGTVPGQVSNGSLVIYIDKVNQAVTFVLPIPILIPIFTDIEIPDLPGAVITTHTSGSLAVRIPLKYLVKGGVFMPNERLPNGDPLPYVPSGELPGFAIQFPQMPSYRIHLYIGTSVAAVFAELPKFPVPNFFNARHVVVPVKNRANTKVIGAVGYVFKKDEYPGGAYVAGQLPAELAAVIDELIRW